MLLGLVGVLGVTVGLGQGGGSLFVVDVADPLQEQEREDVGLEVAGVHGAPEAVGGGPKAALEFLLADSCGAHAETTSLEAK